MSLAVPIPGLARNANGAHLVRGARRGGGVRGRTSLLEVEAGDPVVLSFLGSVSQFAALVEIDGALEGMVRLALVQSDLGAPAHVGVPWSSRS